MSTPKQQREGEQEIEKRGRSRGHVESPRKEEGGQRPLEGWMAVSAFKKLQVDDFRSLSMTSTWLALTATLARQENYSQTGLAACRSMFAALSLLNEATPPPRPFPDDSLSIQRVGCPQLSSLRSRHPGARPTSSEPSGLKLLLPKQPAPLDQNLRPRHSCPLIFNLATSGPPPVH